MLALLLPTYSDHDAAGSSGIANIFELKRSGERLIYLKSFFSLTKVLLALSNMQIDFELLRIKRDCFPKALKSTSEVFRSEENFPFEVVSLKVLRK